MDSIPFVDNLPGVDCEHDEFHDTGTWTEDEEGNVIDLADGDTMEVGNL